MIFHREEGGREGGVSSGTDQAALNLHENKKRRAVSGHSQRNLIAPRTLSLKIQS